MSGQHTHVWTHDNQTEPVNMAHHHGFGERVLRPTEVIVDLAGVEQRRIRADRREVDVDGSPRFLPVEEVRRFALSLLAACERIDRLWSGS